MKSNIAPKDLNALDVYQSSELAGTLSREKGACYFKYSKTFFETRQKSAGGLAVTLPYEQREFSLQAESVFPFFAGLLPEGRRIQALIQSVKTSSDDLFSLLAAIGHQTTGDVYVVPKGQKSSAPNLVEWSERNIIFDQLFEEMLSHDASFGKESAPSIAGVQEKLSASVISFPVSRRKRHAQYILKLSPKAYPRLVENESFFMGVARKAGVETAETEIIYDSENRSGLLVTRFDRQGTRFITDLNLCIKKMFAKFWGFTLLTSIEFRPLNSSPRWIFALPRCLPSSSCFDFCFFLT